MERELWKVLYRLAQTLDTWGNCLYSTADVLGAYFWAVIHDRPTKWAADAKQWPEDLRPAALPPQSTLSRRLRRPKTMELMCLVEDHLRALIVVGGFLVRIFDGKPLGVSNVS